MASSVDPELILSLFSELDADHSGTITAAEIRSFMKESFGLDKRAVVDFVTLLDQNGDGAVSLEELQQAVTARSSYVCRASSSSSDGKPVGIDAHIGCMTPPADEAFLDLRGETLVEWDFSPGGMGRTRNERRAPPTFGVEIKLPEHRSMRLSQLRSLDRHVRRRCVTEGWEDIEHGTLTAEGVSFYDAIAYAIKPATRERRCTLAELVNDAPCPPHWFVSHAWGDQLLNVFRCVEQHGRDRGINANGGAYWLSACAINQWRPMESWYKREGDLESLVDASFGRAMALCAGSLLVIDSEARSLERLWVCYEAHLALSDATGAAHLLDVYTPAQTTFETGRGQEISCNAVGLL